MVQIKHKFSGAVLWENDAIDTLSNANLLLVNLAYANLSYANLSGVNLSGVNLSSVNLSSANLPYTNFSRANLSYANLSYANLSSADLSYANLSRAKISNVDLSGTISTISILPEGKLIGWKKLKEGLCKLEIPVKAKRVNSTGRKCRAEYVKVLALFPRGTKVGHGTYDETPYQVGKIVRPDSYDPDFRVECSHGIHFFITRKEAEAC